MRKAANDLFNADTIIATGQALDTVCFHAQQAAEKSLKALLASEGMDYPLTHDIEQLLLLCAPRFPQVEGFLDNAYLFSLYGVAVRYDAETDPEPGDAEIVLAQARAIHHLVAELLG